MKNIISVCCLLLALKSFGQKIEGTVKDTAGNIMPFASILVKGTTLGATANNNGYYSISLSPGTYTIVCRYVGYASQERTVTLTAGNSVQDFVLSAQQLSLKEVVITQNGEDPAYEIIRQAIKKRPYYESQVKAFEAEVYIKGLMKLRSLPQKIFGQKIPEEDRKNMGIDSGGKGIIYLSESVTKVSVQEPDKAKLEVISSRVSGSNGFGFDFPVFLSFYKNNVSVFSGQLNPRGFVSPIADGALNFYRYKFLGSFFENGKEINTIRVFPKRAYEPLFSGIINITEDDWRIYSCDLVLTKTSQLEVLDTLQITQMHMPVEDDIWRIRSQVLHFSFNQLGISAYGNFVNIYSGYDLHPQFPRNFFNRVVISYDTAVNKKPHAYWDSIRPVPLEPEEVHDYKIKDSAFIARNDSAVFNMDSLKKKQGPVKLTQVFWSGVNRTHYSRTHPYQWRFDPLLKTLQYNTVEGVAINPSLVITAYPKKWNTRVEFIADARYGFNNGHLNPWAGFTFSSRDQFDPDVKLKRQSFFIAGGKRVSQFFKESDITGLGNSIGTLLYGQNTLKIYENYFGKAGFTKKWESGISFLIEGSYEDRLPVENTTDFILNKKWQKRLTPNYPVEIMSSPLQRHQAVVLRASVTMQPGQRYIQFPKYKMAIGSDLPVFTLDYTKGIKNIFGSDVDYDKWLFSIKDESNLRLGGTFRYNVSFGGFLNRKSVFAPDYKHFYASFSHIAGEYVKALQVVTDYQFSNVSPFYTEWLFEHHANGLLTNKIPLLKKLNWNLVEGANLLHMDPSVNYGEFFIGLENILKLFRIDAVVSLRKGFQPVYTYRIGFGGLLGPVFNTQRFKRNEKIIDTW